jgi:eukaryotic-like serine/threonine-protein kinase
VQVVANLAYEKIERIGIGEGMHSEVFLCNDPQLGGRIAIKEIPKASFANTVSKYFDEAQTMFAVAHQNVVPIQYGCETSNAVVLAMPYFKKGSLRKRIETDPLSLQEALHVGHGVLSGLAQIHLGGRLHLDLRPPNILFAGNGKPLVADFGQARLIDDSGIVIAPDTYFRAMPPEVLNKGVATIPSDIYQAGLLLYQAINGDPFYSKQFAGKTDNALFKEIESGKFPDRAKFLPHVPKRLKTIIRKALSVDAVGRFQSSIEMANSLASVRLDLDWCVSSTTNEIEWKARRDSTHLIVQLQEQSWDSKWSVCVFTCKGDNRRARGRDLYWRESLTLADAYKHLKSIFEELK